MIKIKDFSLKTGFSVRMLRYLEEMDVLVPLRDSNNYRSYSNSQISIAKWIKKLQLLGFQLKEIAILNKENNKDQLSILGEVIKREQEVAEIKSETILELKMVFDFLKRENKTIQDFYKIEKSKPKKMKTLGGEAKFHRIAYTIPELKNIYEDHLTIDANIELIATDLMKFQEWLLNIDYVPEVFSIFKESSFTFGVNITDRFIEGYETAWNKYLPKIGLLKLDEFSREDISQLMGPHDVIIRTSFKYRDSGLRGEIVIPYTPIYTMSQLR